MPYEGNPLFAGTGRDTWDREIRERGFILHDGNEWRLWYTGYDSTRSETKSLGLANSPDGLAWTRHPKNPVFDGVWTEDVFVLKHEGLFHDGERLRLYTMHPAVNLRLPRGAPALQ